MKKVNFLEWDDLTEEEKEKLLQEQLDRELVRIIQYGTNECEGQTLMSAINKCYEEKQRGSHLPFFIAEKLRNDPAVRSYLLNISLSILEGCVFCRWNTPKDCIHAYIKGCVFYRWNTRKDTVTESTGVNHGR